jgi:putative inorganic carbon (HCO3(-)) transporter
MPLNRQVWDYEAVTPPARARDDETARGGEPVPPAGGEVSRRGRAGRRARPTAKEAARALPLRLKRGHSLTYAALLLFTCVLYLRPAELWPSALTASLAYFVGVAALAAYLPSQFALEGTPTARPREVNLVLLFCLLALLSMPLAIEPALAWETFSGVFIRCVLIFVIMVNAVRTTARLKGLFAVSLVAALALSVKAVSDYSAGNLLVEGYRVGGVGEGIFGNPNEVALFLVTIAPVVVALALGSRSVVGKLFYAAAALLMLAALMVTFSRGGFLGLTVALAFLAWKVGRRNRFAVAVLAVLCGAALLAAAPSNFTLRVLSIFVPSLDPVGSSDMRQQLLWASIWTAARHPLLGIGMGNFTLVSPRSLVSHNSYTQVASEMGMPALGVYLLFLLTPYRGLSRIERAEHEGRKDSRHYYLVVGLQAALAGYAVSSFFSATAYTWYVYYLVGWCACLRRTYESEVGAVGSETTPHAGEGRRRGEFDAVEVGAAAGRVGEVG